MLPTHTQPVVLFQIRADHLNSIPYSFIDLDAAAGKLSSEWFRSISPNGRVPAIVHVKEDGKSQTVFESAACLQ